MSTASASSPLGLSSFGGSPRARYGLALAATFVAHAALAVGLGKPETPRPSPVIVTEVELAPKLEEPPPAAPEPQPAPDAPEPTQAQARLDAPRAPRTTPAARAGNVLVAKAEAVTAPGDEPVDFVTDPNGTSFRGGVVMRGGSTEPNAGGGAAKKAASPASPVAAPHAAASSDITPASDLRRPPALQSGASCSGFYPREAEADSGLVTVVVVVAGDGTIARLSVSNETPSGQGFAAAARACMRSSRFVGALDKQGQPAKAATIVRVRFTR